MVNIWNLHTNLALMPLQAPVLPLAQEGSRYDERLDTIIKLRKDGKSLESIAKEHGISITRVVQLIEKYNKQAKPEDKVGKIQAKRKK